MRFVTALLELFLCFVASPAFAVEVRIANATPYEILGFFLEGMTGDGRQVSSFSAVRALPGESCGEKDGSMETLTALQVDFGRGRVAVRDCALKGMAELTLGMDDGGRAVLSTPGGKALPLEFSDLRFPADDAGGVDFIELVDAATREDVLRLGGPAARDFKDFGDVVVPVRLGGTVWTGSVGFARGGGIARIRLMAERSSDAWKEVLSEFLEAFELRPLSLAMPDGAVLRFYEQGEANTAASAEEAREQLVMLVADDAVWEDKPEGKLTALLGTESAFLDCAQPKRPASPSLGAVLILGASNLVTLDVEKDISGRVELERMR